METTKKYNKLASFANIKDLEFKKSSVCLNDTVITEIPPDGIIISNSGTYKFGNNIMWNPVGILNIGITIVAADVVLDLNNYTFECGANNLLSVGIAVFGQNKITITNGRIKNMGLGHCICIGTNDLTITELNVDGLTLNNKIFPAFGIAVISSTNVRITNVVVHSIKISGTASAAILLADVINSNISKCKLYDLENDSGVCSGLSQIQCTNSTIKKLKIRNLRTGIVENTLAPGHTCIGILSFVSTELSYNKCCIKNIKGSCDDAHGISLFVVKNASVKNSIVENVFDGCIDPIVCSTGAKATGIEIYGWSDLSNTDQTIKTIRPDANIIVYNCRVKNITAINPGDKQAAGFSVAGTNIKFDRCSATNVNVYNNDNLQNMNTGLGCGFGWAPDIRDVFIYPAYRILYTKCKATDCQLGFDTFYHIKSKWSGVKSINNGIDILLINNSQRTLFCTKCSECPDAPNNGFKYVTINNIASDNKVVLIRSDNADVDVNVNINNECQ